MPASADNSELTEIEEQRKELHRNVHLHLSLLLHAVKCDTANCPSAQCAKMKGVLNHGRTCTQLKTTGSCDLCRRIWALLQLHARKCKVSMCPVPKCMAIRERLLQLKRQQQALEDRRRHEMNRFYGRMG